MQEYTVKVSDDRIVWLQNGIFHRNDGPAIEYKNGNKFWYQNGKLHRMDAPAIEYADGEKFWFQNGKQHRIDGPAVEYKSGNVEYVEYWENGKPIPSPNETKEMTVTEIIKELGYNVKVVK